MYLSEVKIWNFRKFGSKLLAGGIVEPGLSLRFNAGFNLIVGENDSGKTALIDAIRFVLQTQSFETYRLAEDDFYIPTDDSQEKNRATELRIECVFRGLEIQEAKHFIEWTGFEKDEKKNDQYYLKVFLKAKRENGRVYYDVRAGVDSEGALMDAKARELLRVTYLKPLRDADFELAPRKNSRLSQILDSHEAFQDKESHPVLKIVKKANKDIECYFKGCDGDGKEIDDKRGKELHAEINEYLETFSSSREPGVLSSGFEIAAVKLRAILERLSLDLDLENPGLGSNNLLFIAAELLLLKRVGYSGLRLLLVEEAEAHLHPQAQLRLIDYLEKEAEKSKIQLIISSHSPNLASKVTLENLVIFKDGKSFPMAAKFTELELGDYAFLQRFLDVTKANLFFAQGVILVEGDAENLLLPTIANILDLPLSKYGVSIVNVGSTAFLRYARIFQRKDGLEPIPIPVACITDCDVKPDKVKGYSKDAKTEQDYRGGRAAEKARKEALYTGQLVKTFVSSFWTLEYDIALTSFSTTFYKSVLCAKALENSDKYGVIPDKLAGIEKKVADDFKNWEEASLSHADIAFEIYYNTMLKEKISKAIVAQFFAKFLNEGNKETLKKDILAEPNFAYLVNALRYATGRGGESA